MTAEGLDGMHPQNGSGVRRPERERLRRRTRRVLVRRGDLLAVIAAGGALGSLARWGLTQLLPHAGDAFPWATFDANVTGCFALGVLMVFVTDVWPPSRYLRPFLGVGVLGGYTTFSTYMLDTRALLLSGQIALAGAYLFGSLAAGLAGVWAGVTLTRGVVAGARRRADRGRAARSGGATPSTEVSGAAHRGSEPSGLSTRRSSP